MQGFPHVVYIRKDGSESSSKSNLKASIFQSELMQKGGKIKAGVYRLTNVVDVAGKPEPKKTDTEKPAKGKAGKGKK